MILDIVYIQNFIYLYKNEYVIIEKYLNELLNINVVKLLKKYKKIFNRKYYYKVNNNYLLNKEGIVFISIILNSFYIDEIIYYILDAFYTLEKINKKVLNKISYEE